MEEESQAIVLHEDKQYYPSALQVYGENVSKNQISVGNFDHLKFIRCIFIFILNYKNCFLKLWSKNI